MIHDLPEIDQDPALQNLACQLLILEPKSDASSQYYVRGGQKVITSSLIAFYHQGIDFCDICRKIVTLSYQDLFAEIAETGNELAYSYISSYEGGLEQHISGIKETAADAVMLFANNQKVYSIMHRSTDTQRAICAKDLEHGNIFLNVDDPKTSIYNPMTRIITAQIMEYISNRKVDKHSKPILLCLDEFASLKIDETFMLDALRKYRKRRCRILIMTQSISDLRAFYGHDKTISMITNLNFKVLTGGLNDPETRKYFADLIGYKEITKKSITKGSNNAQSITETQTREYIIEPADLDRQGNDKLIVITPDGPGYLILDKYYYFKHEEDDEEYASYNLPKIDSDQKVIRKTVDKIEYIDSKDIVIDNPEDILFGTGKWEPEEYYLDYWKMIMTYSQDLINDSKKDLIELKMRPDGTYVVISDGRHRAYVAKKHKLTNIPVHIINEDVYE